MFLSQGCCGACWDRTAVQCLPFPSYSKLILIKEIKKINALNFFKWLNNKELYFEERNFDKVNFW